MTDWNRELNVLKQYLDFKVDHWFPKLSLRVEWNNMGYTPEELYRQFVETGWMVVDVNPEKLDSELTFEEWRKKYAQNWIETELDPELAWFSRAVEDHSKKFWYEQIEADQGLWKIENGKTYYNLR